MRKSVLLAALIFLLTNISYAEVIEDLTINADSISYSEDGYSLEAAGSVEAISGGTKIAASHITCNLRTKDIIADKSFQMMLKGEFNLSGEYLDYNFKTKKGSTRNVKIVHRTSVITGNFAYVDEEKVELKGASFNTCGLEPPHYQVSSFTTTLYLGEGWLIGYLGYLWIDGVPAVPVPAYIFNLSAYGVGRRAETKDVMSVPEIGSNDQDGVFIIYKVPWIASRKLNGKLVLFNTEKGGLGGGLEGNYEADESNDVYFRAYHDQRYNYYGGITHKYYFGPKLEQAQKYLYTLFRIKEQLMFELVTNVSYNERINYERVSTLPDVTLRMNDVPAFFGNFKIGGEVSFGRITEESSGVGDDRGNIKTSGYFDISIPEIGLLYAGIGYNQSWYGLTSSWTRLSQNIRLSRDLPAGINSYISHLHHILYDGNSPFRYEMYFTLPSDELGFGLGYNFDVHRVSLDYNYYVPDWEPKDLDYGLSIGLHCYNIDLKYRTTRKEFLVGISLVSR